MAIRIIEMSQCYPILLLVTMLVVKIEVRVSLRTIISDNAVWAVQDCIDHHLAVLLLFLGARVLKVVNFIAFILAACCTALGELCC